MPKNNTQVTETPETEVKVFNVGEYIQANKASKSAAMRHMATMDEFKKSDGTPDMGKMTKHFKDNGYPDMIYQFVRNVLTRPVKKAA